MQQDRSPFWPLDQARDEYSQAGEDGIAEAILAQLPGRNNWVVEFGAWDGLHLSNSRHFIMSHEFSAVLIEGSPDRFADLQSLYRDRPDVHTLNVFVRTSGDDTLDQILARTPIPQDFDYLSIDIDGNDYHVWKSLAQFRPKLVCIEFNPTVPSDVSFIQADDFGVKHGTGLLSMVELGREKGYELATLTAANAFFVQEELFDILQIADNSIGTLRRDTSAVTHVFSGYDGTVFVVGNKELPWHQMPMRLSGRQDLPSFLRKFPLDYGPARKFLFYSHFATRHPIDLARKVIRWLRRRSGKSRD